MITFHYRVVVFDTLFRILYCLKIIDCLQIVCMLYDTNNRVYMPFEKENYNRRQICKAFYLHLFLSIIASVSYISPLHIAA